MLRSDLDPSEFPLNGLYERLRSLLTLLFARRFSDPDGGSVSFEQLVEELQTYLNEEVAAGRSFSEVWNELWERGRDGGH